MPKHPTDETKISTEDTAPDALRPRSLPAAAAESPRSPSEAPYARAPAPMRQRKSPLGLIIVLLALAAIATGIWYFFFR
ncbi:MAG: hypothetical protein ABL956_00180 [Hyphomonadaceae bacterium]